MSVDAQRHQLQSSNTHAAYTQTRISIHLVNTSCGHVVLRSCGSLIACCFHVLCLWQTEAIYDQLEEALAHLWHVPDTASATSATSADGTAAGVAEANAEAKSNILEAAVEAAVDTAVDSSTSNLML